MSVATMFNWSFNFLVSFFFLQMTEAVGAGTTFAIYALCGAAAAAFFAFKLPETKNRTLEEIEERVDGVEISRTPAAATKEITPARPSNGPCRG